MDQRHLRHLNQRLQSDLCPARLKWTTVIEVPRDCVSLRGSPSSAEHSMGRPDAHDSNYFFMKSVDKSAHENSFLSLRFFSWFIFFDKAPHEVCEDVALNGRRRLLNCCLLLHVSLSREPRLTESGAKSSDYGKVLRELESNILLSIFSVSHE